MVRTHKDTQNESNLLFLVTFFAIMTLSEQIKVSQSSPSMWLSVLEKIWLFWALSRQWQCPEDDLVANSSNYNKNWKSQNKLSLAIVTTYSNDFTSRSFVCYCHMIRGTKLPNLSVLSSWSRVILVNFRWTQRGAAIFYKSAKIFRFTRQQTLERQRLGFPNGLSWCHPRGARLKKWSFWGGWKWIEDCHHPWWPGIFLPVPC